jgi:hypothetical protein
VIEVEVDLHHNATGKDLSGLLHRARQARAIARELTRRKAWRPTSNGAEAPGVPPREAPTPDGGGSPGWEGSPGAREGGGGFPHPPSEPPASGDPAPGGRYPGGDPEPPGGTT